MGNFTCERVTKAKTVTLLVVLVSLASSASLLAQALPAHRLTYVLAEGVPAGGLPGISTPHGLPRFPNQVNGESLDLFDIRALNHLLAPNLEELWVQHYKRAAEGKRGANAYAMSPVAGGGFVLAGSIPGKGGSLVDCLVVRYRPNGTREWVNKYSGAGKDHLESCEAVTVDQDGNVVAVGIAWLPGQHQRWAIIKLSPEGELLWSDLRFASADGGSGNAQALAVVTDSAGNVYVTGRSGSPTRSSYDILVLKFSPGGEHLWSYRFGEDQLEDEPFDMAIDDADNIVVVGSSESPAGDEDWVTLKLAPDGSLLWRRRVAGKGGGDDEARAVALDAQGNIYVTGDRVRKRGDSDVLTVKYSTSGRRVWKRRWNGPGKSGDGGLAVAVAPDGGVFVTGATWGGDHGDGGSQWDYVTLHYSSQGARHWVRRFIGEGNWIDYPTDIFANDSAVYVTGRGYLTPFNLAFLTLRYDHTGELTDIVSHPTNLYSKGPFLAVQEDEIYVAGNNFVPGTNGHVTALKYRQR